MKGAGDTPLFGLAPGGVCPATGVATGAVRSYRTISPLPLASEARTRAVYFLWHFPWARAPQALPGTLPFGARTFLPPDPRRDQDSGCSAGSHRNVVWERSLVRINPSFLQITLSYALNKLTNMDMDSPVCAVAVQCQTLAGGTIRGNAPFGAGRQVGPAAQTGLTQKRKRVDSGRKGST